MITPLKPRCQFKPPVAAALWNYALCNTWCVCVSSVYRDEHWLFRQTAL